MWLNQWYTSWRSRLARASRASNGTGAATGALTHPARRSRRRAGVRLRLEQLEDRTLPSSYTAATVSELIADIKAANKDGRANTITLTAPTTSPYVLTAVDNTGDGPTGLPQIASNDSLTIMGHGDTIERSTASGTPAFRLFDVASGGALTLNNLTLQNGLAFGSGRSAEGGAIYNQGTLLLSGATVQGNGAVGSYGADATVRGHVGDSGLDAAGGGIWSNGSLTLENGTQILSNLALGGNGGLGFGDPSNCNRFANGGNASGGGVYVGGGTANFSSTSLSNNGAVGGAAGYSPASSFTDEFGEGNGGSAFGGALDVAAGTVSLTGVLVNGNAARGGFQWNGFQYSFILCVPSKPPPLPNGYGGGIFVGSGAVTLSSGTVENNAAIGGYGSFTPFVRGYGDGFGGGVYVASGGTVTASNDTVSSNSADGPSSSGNYGGGIYIASGATVSFCNDTVQSNTATYLGGGIYIESGATVYIDSFTVANTINNTDSSGLNGPTANIDGTYILQNC